MVEYLLLSCIAESLCGGSFVDILFFGVLESRGELRPKSESFSFKTNWKSLFYVTKKSDSCMLLCRIYFE